MEELDLEFWFPPYWAPLGSSFLLLYLGVWRGKAGGSNELVEADAAAPAGPDVQQGDVVPAVPAGAAEGDELLVLHNETDLGRRPLPSASRQREERRLCNSSVSQGRQSIIELQTSDDTIPGMFARWGLCWP